MFEGCSTVEEVAKSLSSMFEIDYGRVLKDLYTLVEFAEKERVLLCEGGVSRLAHPDGHTRPQEVRSVHQSKDVPKLPGRGVIGFEPNELSAPLSVLFELTYRCNLKCMHCFTFSPRASKELSTEEWFQIIDQLSKYKVPIVFLSGGEPLLRHDFLDIAAYLKKKNISACLLTNGTLLTRDLIRAIKSETSIVKIELNLDSHLAEVYDKFRGVKGAFEKTINAIKLCLEEGIPIRVNVTVTKLNIDHLDKIAEYAAMLGVPEIVFVPLRPSGRALENMSELYVSPEEYYRAMLKLREVRKKLRSKNVITVSEFDEEVNSIINPLRVFPACGAGRLHFTIDPEGNAKLCPSFPSELNAGNVLGKDLKEVWNSKLFIYVRREASLPEPCRRCPERDCLGGCLIRGYWYNGGLLKGPDPLCKYRLSRE